MTWIFKHSSASVKKQLHNLAFSFTVPKKKKGKMGRGGRKGHWFGVVIVTFDLFGNKSSEAAVKEGSLRHVILRNNLST